MSDTSKRYHECRCRYKNGTRRLIVFKRGEKCVLATDEPYWRPVKLKYLRGRYYDTRTARRNFIKEFRDQYRDVARKIIFDSINEKFSKDIPVCNYQIKMDASRTANPENPEGIITSRCHLFVQNLDGNIAPVIVDNCTEVSREPQPC